MDKKTIDPMMMTGAMGASWEESTEWSGWTKKSSGSGDRYSYSSATPSNANSSSASCLLVVVPVFAVPGGARSPRREGESPEGGFRPSVDSIPPSFPLARAHEASHSSSSSRHFAVDEAPPASTTVTTSPTISHTHPRLALSWRCLVPSLSPWPGAREKESLERSKLFLGKVGLDRGTKTGKGSHACHSWGGDPVV